MFRVLTYRLLAVCYLPYSNAALINVAAAKQGTVAIADSSYAKFSADQAIDGQIPGPNEPPDINRWHSGLDKPHPHWIWLRFRERARIEKIIIHRADLEDYPVDFVGEYSPDGGVTFITLFAVINNQMNATNFVIEQVFKPKAIDNFRLRILKSSYGKESDHAQLSELEVLGEFIGPMSPISPAQPADHFKPPALASSSLEGLQITRTSDQIEFRSKWLRIAFSTNSPRVTALCWDSLGEGKVTQNLLRTSPDAGVSLSQRPLFPEPTHSELVKFELDKNVLRYSITKLGTRGSSFFPSQNSQSICWEIRVEPKTIRIVIASSTPKESVCREPLGLRFVFDPAIAPVAPLANPRRGATAPLPLLLHAADYGTLLAQPIPENDELVLMAQPGIRSAVRWDAFIRKAEKPRPDDGLFLTRIARTTFDLSVEACAPLPALAQDDPRLRGLARSWLNVFQYRPEMGILANNPLSDNAVLCLFTYTDPAIFTPPLPGNIDVINLARESLDQYFAGAPGYGVGREDSQPDVYPALLISAWDVVRVTGDMELLKRWLPTLEKLAAKAIAQDHDGNGLPESTRSGVSGAFRGPTGNWWDQINFGHEDAYVSALSFRAFRALADLERLTGRTEEAERFEKQAEKIRTAYVPTFLNPKTGIIAGWKDAKGELHDYWFLFINGMAITYGLVPEQLANSILDRCEAKLKEVGYTRFDLGLPGNLVPIAKSDYGQATLGSPKNDDGSDTLGSFQNGGASACYAYFYVQALYQMGRRTEAERILWPMMESFAKGNFQNGVGHGAEWRYWDGRPSGYEGFLADAYYAQMALFTGHYGVGFDPDGFHLKKWSPLNGKEVPLGLKYMGRILETIR